MFKWCFLYTTTLIMSETSSQHFKETMLKNIREDVLLEA